MPELSIIAKGLKQSSTRKVFALAATLTDVVDFSLGEPDFVTPRPIIDEAIKAWDAGMTHYTPNAGIIELRRAIADHFSDRFTFDPETQMIITTGATEALMLTLMTTVNLGEEVIVFTPQWPNYEGEIHLVGAKPVYVPMSEENGFIPDIEALKRAITPLTKLIMLNSPSNPTGACVDADTLSEIAKICLEHNIFLLTDEIYRSITFDGKKAASMMEHQELADRMIFVDGFSKAYAMTGWRIGFIISSPEIIAKMTILHETSTSNLPRPTQLAAAYALTNCQSDADAMRDAYEERRNYVFNRINAIPGLSMIKPSGAFYAFVNAKKTGLDDETFCKRLLLEAKVAVVPGSGFGPGGEGFFRLSYASSLVKLEEGLNRIEAFMKELMGAYN